MLAIVGLAGGIAHAQLSGKGEIKGTVKDPSGAVVANATVTATDVSTGVSTSRTSNTSGEFDISPLDPAIYNLSVTANGFEKLTQNDVHVNALEIANYNPVLTVGSSSEHGDGHLCTAATGNVECNHGGATMEQEMYPRRAAD